MGRREPCKNTACNRQSRVKGLCGPCYQQDRYKATRDKRLKVAKENHKLRTAHREKVLKEFDNSRGVRVTSRMLSLQALSAARRAEERVTSLMTNLGMNAPVLQRDNLSVILLLEELIHPIARAQLTSPNYLRYWGGVFFGMDETYLEAVGILLQADEPWKLFVDFANRLTRSLHKEGAEALRRSQELQVAYRYYASARTHLLHVSYLLCRRRHGRRTADEVFGDKPTAVDEIHALLLH
jgi:hypothetical protein